MVPRSHRSATLLLVALVAAGCGRADAPPAGSEVEETLPEAAPNPVVALLESDRAVFGIFAGEKSADGGAASMSSQRADFQLYSLERGPFDVPTLEAYLAGMREAGGPGATTDFPVVVRTPAIHTAPDSVPVWVERAMATGIAGITFPHVTTAAEAARATQLLGEPWPVRPDAESVNILIVEDRQGIENVREIVQTPGLSVVFAGPGDLRRAYEGDMAAVEEAIQAVLAACLEFQVPCGVTAGVDDIAERLDQGFRVIIVTEPEAVEVGMRHAGRTVAPTGG